MIKRNTWILLLVFAVVLATAITLQKTNLLAPQVSPTATPAPSLLNFANDSLSEITLTNSTGLKVDSQLENGQWSIVSPPGLVISQGNMQQIISELNGISVQSKLLSPLPLESTGLQVPTYTLTMKYASGQTHTFKVGSLTATNSGYYVQVDSNDAVIVNQSGIDNIIELLKSVTYTPTPTTAPDTATPATTQTTPEVATDTPTAAQATPPVASATP